MECPQGKALVLPPPQIPRDFDLYVNLTCHLRAGEFSSNL
jgi:hypothetical protein